MPQTSRKTPTNHPHPPASAHHADVFVIEVGQPTRYLVRPPTFIAPRGKADVCFLNLTGGEVVISSPEMSVADCRIPSGARCDLRLPGQQKAFEYSVSVTTGGKQICAKGNSAPIIIVDP